METGFGRTRESKTPAVYNVVFSYTEENVGLFAAESAVSIAEALIATAIGLFAAIPAVLAFNHYTGKGETVYSDRALFAEEMVALLQRQSLGETKEHD